MLDVTREQNEVVFPLPPRSGARRGAMLSRDVVHPSQGMCWAKRVPSHLGSPLPETLGRLKERLIQGFIRKHSQAKNIPPAGSTIPGQRRAGSFLAFFDGIVAHDGVVPGLLAEISTETRLPGDPEGWMRDQGCHLGGRDVPAGGECCPSIRDVLGGAALVTGCFYPSAGGDAGGWDWRCHPDLANNPWGNLPPSPPCHPSNLGWLHPSPQEPPQQPNPGQCCFGSPYWGRAGLVWPAGNKPRVPHTHPALLYRCGGIGTWHGVLDPGTLGREGAGRCRV